MTDPAPTPSAADLAALQAQIDQSTSTAVEAAKRQAYLDALATLGVTDLDQAATAIKAKNAADAANQSDLDKAKAAQAAAEQAKAAAEQATAAAAAQANQLALAAMVDRELIAAGHPLTGLERTARLIDVPADTDPGQVAALVTSKVTALKTEVPALFTGTAVVPPPAPGLPGAKPPAPGAGGKTMEQVGREVAQRQGLPARPAMTAA